MKRIRYIKGDRVIWITVIFLAVISLLAVYSSSQSLAYSSANGTFYYLIKQIVILFIGFVFLFLAHTVPYHYYSKLSQILLYVVIVLLIFTLIAGRDVNSARRAINIPGFGITMQPSDFAKIILIMYVARILSLKQEALNNFKETFLPLMGWVGFVCFLILPANFSTAALLFGTSMTLMFIGRIPISYLLLTLVGAALIFFLFLQALNVLNIDGRAGTWERRIENFWNKDNESVNNYQTNRAKVAIVNGGLIGKGPGNSLQKEKLPQANSDFIYAVIIEEYGLLGGIIILLLYMYILFRTALIVRKSVRTFPAMLAMGLSLLIVFQALINMGVAVNLIPVTGQPLPYISSGGSSVVFTSIAIGVILSVSWGIEEDQKNLSEVESKLENGE